MGMVLYILWQELFNNKYYKKAVMIFSVLIILACICIFIVMHRFNWYVWCYMTLPSFILLLVNLPQIKLNYTGILCEITFQLYLWHVVCFYIFQFVLDLNNTSFTHTVFSMLFMTIVCVFISWIVYKLVDVPLAEYLKRKGI